MHGIGQDLGDPRMAVWVMPMGDGMTSPWPVLGSCGQGVLPVHSTVGRAWRTGLLAGRVVSFEALPWRRAMKTGHGLLGTAIRCVWEPCVTPSCTGRQQQGLG